MPDDLSNELPWLELRRQMPVAARYAYLDHAAVAPLTAPARDAVIQWSHAAADSGDLHWSTWAEQVRNVRLLCSSLIGTDSENLAFVPNTTAGIGLVAEGLPWRPGDNVVTLANEFPSNLYPWMNLRDRGVETRLVKAERGRVDMEQILERCDARTRLISVSWVGYASGWRLDVDWVVRRAHERGILVLLDAIQGLGVFPLNVADTPVDFLAADGHKWMLGPEGAGIFYIRPQHLDLLHPIGVGWNSVVQASEFDRIDFHLRPTARRFEGGSQNMVGVMALGASLQLLESAGLASGESAIAERVLAITDYACERLQEVGACVLSHREGERRSGIVTFQVPGQDPDQLRRACLQAGVVVSCRGGGVRISPHAYANRDDIERLIEVIRPAVA